MKKSRWIFLLVLPAAMVVLFATLVAGAGALPSYATQTGEPCATCHVDPAGGGTLTAAGETFKNTGQLPTTPPPATPPPTTPDVTPPPASPSDVTPPPAFPSDVTAPEMTPSASDDAHDDLDVEEVEDVEEPEDADEVEEADDAHQAEAADEGAEGHQADHQDGDRDEEHTYGMHSEEDHMTQSESVVMRDDGTHEDEQEEHHDD